MLFSSHVEGPVLSSQLKIFTYMQTLLCIKVDSAFLELGIDKVADLCSVHCCESNAVNMLIQSKVAYTI